MRKEAQVSRVRSNTWIDHFKVGYWRGKSALQTTGRELSTWQKVLNL